MRHALLISTPLLIAGACLPWPALADEESDPPSAAAEPLLVEADDDPYPNEKIDGEQQAPSPPPGEVLDPLTRSEKLILDTGRVTQPQLTFDDLTLALHGEYQLRYRAFSDLPLQAPISNPSATLLGQNHYLYHWLRLTPVLQYSDKLKVVGQIDVPRGAIVGDTTQWVGSARDSFDELTWYGVRPRQLYIEYVTPIGMFRIGQQGSHWGMGLLANDGDHPSLFGDYRRGALVERLLFATKPMGRDEPLVIALAGDLVFEDARAELMAGDRALQGVAAIRWRAPEFELGLYGVYRYQERDQESVDALTPFVEDLEVGVVSLAGRFAIPIDATRATIHGQFEGALQAGSTNYVRNIDQTRAGEREDVLAFGGALSLTAVHEAGSGAERWGDIAVSVELGYASGDADPGDGVTRRFTFDQNHNVGLVLFDHVMAWMTARSATIARDPALMARAPAGIQFVPSEGGVFGASYLYPTIVVRPQPWLDLKAGMVIAQTTADLVDPFHYGALGNYANYYGGNDKRHDLGLELDLGVDGRIEVVEGLVIQVGAEGGLLLPGHALDDVVGESLPLQYLINTKLGLQF